MLSVKTAFSVSDVLHDAESKVEGTTAAASAQDSCQELQSAERCNTMTLVIPQG